MFKIIKYHRILFCCFLGLLLSSPAAYAESITLAWNASDPGLADVAGYNIYYRKESEDFKFLDEVVGNVTVYKVKNLDKKEKYYFAVKAYAGGGEESVFSEEVSTLNEFQGTANISSRNSCAPEENPGNSAAVQLSFDFLREQVSLIFEPEDPRISCNPCTIIQCDNATIEAVKKGPLGIVTFYRFIFEGFGNVALQDQLALIGKVNVFTFFYQDCPRYVMEMEVVRTGL